MESYKDQLNMYGLINLGNTCFANSLLQSLFLCDDYNREIFEINHKKDKLLTNYKKIFENFDMGRKAFRLTSFMKLFRERLDMGGQSQEDAYEALIKFLDYLHDRMKTKEAMDVLEVDGISKKELNIIFNQRYSIVNKFFYGLINNQIKCSKCGNKTKRIETHKGFQVQIENVDTLKEAMEDYFKPETIEDYHCEKCDERVNCEKSIIPITSPKYLYINLKRFSFDMKTLRKRKINKMIDFGEELEYNGKTYELISVVNHMGNIGRGHYTSFSKLKEQWYEADDETIREWRTDKIKTRCAYLLLYKCKE